MSRISTKILFANIFIFCGAIGLLEIGSFAVNSALEIRNTWSTNLETDSDAARTIEYLPSKEYEEYSIARDHSTQLIHYSLDEYNRRLDPRLDRTREEYLILMGDSYVYGVGVAADETISSKINNGQQHYSVYNYGVPGTAPHQYLKRFEKTNLRSEIKNPSGAMVLLVYDMHILRTSLSMSWLAASSPNQVYYWLDKDEQLRGGKSLRQTKPFTYYGFHLLARSNIRKLISNFIPKQEFRDSQIYSQEELLLFAKVIEKIYFHYKEQFGNERFYVFYAGRSRPSLERTDIKYLRDKGIKHFVGIELGVSPPEDTLLDGHYNSSGTSKVAKNILEKLKQLD